MKIGDKLYCNRSYYDRYGYCRYTIGYYYSIVFIRNNNIVDLRSNNGHAYGFSTTCDTIGECKPLNFFFDNEKQIRKRKLKKINGDK